MERNDSSNGSATFTFGENYEKSNAPYLQTLFDESPLGIYLIDADFRIRAVNPKALSVFGDSADLIGSDFDNIVHLIWEKDFADDIVRVFRRTLETGEPFNKITSIEKRRDRSVTDFLF